MKPATTMNLVMGQVIQHHRKGKELKQADFAKALGITQSAYSRLERGESTFSFTQLLRMAPLCGVSADRLVEQAMTTSKALDRLGVHVILDISLVEKLNWLWVSDDVLADAVRAKSKHGATRGRKR